MFLSSSDFINRPYRVINQEESRDFQAFIEKQEVKLLIDLLGYSLWAEMEEDLKSSNPSEIFTALKNGAEYTFNGKTYKYNGLVDLLIPAVFSRWIDQNNYKLTAAGFVQTSPSQENLTVVDPEPFIVAAWNDYVSKVGECYNQKNTLYGFMKANEDEFPNWEFTLPTLKNRYGL